MKRLLYISLIFCALLPSYGKKKEKKRQAEIPKQEQRLSDNDLRRYQYFYLEALTQEGLGNNAEAFDLYRHCLEIDSLASEAHFAISDFYSSIGKDSLALWHLRKANSLDPKNDEFAERLGQYYLSQNMIEEGTRVYERLADMCRDRSDFLDILARIYQYKKDYPKMLETLNRLEVAEGQSENLTLSKMQVYSSMGDEKGAYEELSRLVKSHPNDLNYKVMMGNWLLANSRKDEALKAYKAVLKEEPGNPQAQMSLMDYYRATGNSAEADTLLYQILENPETEAQTRISLMRQVVADNEQGGGDSTRILNIFSRILSLPQLTSDMAEMHVAYMNFKHMPQDSILSGLNRVLAINPENIGARLQRLDIMWRDTIDEKVIAECEKAIDYTPEETALYYYLGLAKYLNKDDAGALKALRKGATTIKEETPKEISSRIYMIVGDILHSMNKAEEAYAAYDSCLNINPNEISCLNNYAYYLSEENRDLKRAEQMSYKTIKAEPENVTYLDTYAWILYMQKRYEEARIYIDQALKNDTVETSSVIWEHAGDIYIRLGLKSDASNYWQKAIDSGADNATEIRKKIARTKK
jgi:tetratricopeptide (TPR) repeat protein